MKKFLPDTECNEMTPAHWQQLSHRIRMRRHRENIFVAFHFPDQWGNVSAELAGKLQCLPQFWLQAPDASASLLLVSEPCIDAFIAESINLIESYRPYVR